MQTAERSNDNPLTTVERPVQEPLPGDVVVPGDLFGALMNVIEAQPYIQVAGIVDAVRQRAWQVDGA